MTSLFDRTIMVFYSHSGDIFRLSATLLKLGYMRFFDGRNSEMPISAARRRSRLEMTSPIDFLTAILYRLAVESFAEFTYRGQEVWGILG
jgi:hypothetical protein